MWERWNSYTIKEGFGDVNMNSFNHYAYGAIEEWIMSHNLGIQRDENRPGYKHILMQPKIDDTFSFVKGGFRSVYGDISGNQAFRNGNRIHHSRKHHGHVHTAGKQHGQPETQKREERC